MLFVANPSRQCRRDRCHEQVGEGFLSLHQAGLPHQLAPTARYWRHLWYQADRMDHVRWWKSGSEIINSSADQVLCLQELPWAPLCDLGVPGKSRNWKYQSLKAWLVLLQADARAFQVGDASGTVCIAIAS